MLLVGLRVLHRRRGLSTRYEVSRSFLERLNGWCATGEGLEVDT